jgi:hypothetical protein
MSIIVNQHDCTHPTSSELLGLDIYSKIYEVKIKKIITNLLTGIRNKQ